MNPLRSTVCGGSFLSPPAQAASQSGIGYLRASAVDASLEIPFVVIDSRGRRVFVLYDSPYEISLVVINPDVVAAPDRPSSEIPFVVVYSGIFEILPPGRTSIVLRARGMWN